MSTSRLQRTIQHYRDQLKAHEAKAERALNYAHAHTLKAIQPQLDRLYHQIAVKQQAGEDIPLSWLYEERRLETIKQLITNQVDHFGALAQMQTGQLQHQSVALGTKAAQDQLDALTPAGVNWSFGVPHPAAIHNLVGATQQGSPLYDLFNGFGTEAAKGASHALITGITLGQNPRQIAAQVEQALDVPRWRALTISRTEMLRAYRGANLETFRANKDVVKQWRWTCDKSARTCAACLAMDGELFDLDQDMESHPNCRCTPVPLTASWDDILGPLGIDTSDIEDSSVDDMESGSDWLDSQDMSTQKQILGAKYDGWANGDFTLQDIVGKKQDPDWGGSIYEKPLKALAK